MLNPMIRSAVLAAVFCGGVSFASAETPSSQPFTPTAVDVLLQDQALAGHVVSESGHALRADVVLIHKGKVVQSVRTTTDGDYKFHELARGTYQIAAFTVVPEGAESGAAELLNVLTVRAWEQTAPPQARETLTIPQDKAVRGQYGTTLVGPIFVPANVAPAPLIGGGTLIGAAAVAGVVVGISEAADDDEIGSP